jgi:hypothetical protein
MNHRGKSGLIKALAGVFLVYCVYIAVAVRFPVTNLGLAMATLPLGWLRFLERNIPKATLNWSMIVTGVLFSIGVMILGHGIFRGIFAQIQTQARPGGAAKQWPWRWTLSLYLSMWLLFLVAFGAAGVYRHATWLVAYQEPWVQINRDN